VTRVWRVVGSPVDWSTDEFEFREQNTPITASE
jgi:hypothetical protein